MALKLSPAGAQALPSGATVYLDTNPLIYLTEGSPAFKERISGLFAKLHEARARLITSELALTETLVHPLRKDDAQLVAAYDRLFRELVNPLPVSREVLLLAAKLRAQSPKLRTPDAIHIATAVLAKAYAFVSNDKGLGVLPGGMRNLSV